MDVVDAQLSFSRREDVAVDEVHGDGILRAPAVASLDELTDDRFDRVTCRVRDCGGAEGLDPSLHEHGFALGDLSGFESLQQTLERVRVAGRIEPEEIRSVRRAMRGRSLPLSGGARIRLFYIAPEGFIMRRAGPNGSSADPSCTRDGANDHEAAVNVHVDQDVLGTPVRQILRGLAPRLFHHDSPTCANPRSPLFLVNVWIPLQQIIRPLVLADRRSLDRRAHQVRMALPTQELFERAPDRRFNDIYALLHHPKQRWYFNPEMGPRRAYVFETLSTPHGACILPGEALAETLRQRLVAAIEAVERHDVVGLRAATAGDHGRVPRTTAPLERALRQMQRVLDDAHAHAASLGAPGGEPSGWLAQARAAADAVVRMSIEMRALGWVTRTRRGLRAGGGDRTADRPRP